MAEGVSIFDLAARITADTQAADKNLTATQQKVLQLAENFKKLDSHAATSGQKVSHATSQITKGTHEAHAGSSKLAESLRALSSSALVSETPLGGLASQIQSLAGEASELGKILGPGGLVLGGLIAIGGAALIAGVGLFELAKSSAEAHGKLFDLSQQTGVSVETLSALEVLAKTTGSDIGAISASLGIFQKKLEEAQDPTSKLSNKFSKLNIDVTNTEDALRGTFTALSKMPEGFHQTATALELFGRGGKSILAILKETHGSLDTAMAKFRQLGILISTEDAKAADEFNDTLTILNFQLHESLALIVGEVSPQIVSAMKSISQAFADNQETFREWGTQLSEWFSRNKDEVIAWGATFISTLHDVASVIYTVVQGVVVLAKEINDLGAELNKIAQGATISSDEAFQRTNQLLKGDQDQLLKGAAPEGFSGKLGRSGGGGGGGGGGKGGGGGGDPAAAAKRLADLRLQAVLIELKAEEDANARSLARQWEDFNQYATRYNATEDRRHKAVVAGLADELTAAEKIKGSQKRAIAIQEIKNKQAQEENTHTTKGNKVLDDRAKLLDQLNDFIANQVKEINYARAGTDQYEKAIQELEIALKKAGVTEIDYKLALARTNAETQRAIDLVKALTRERRAIAERPRFAEDKNFPQSIGIEIDTTDATRKRRATQLPDWLYKILPGGDVDEKLHQLAGSITATLDNAIHEGFTKGVKAGLETMLLGFVQMLEKMAQEWLASSIFKMLQGAFTPNQTGGQTAGGTPWWAKVLGIAIGAAGGIAGGAAGGGGGHGASPHPSGGGVGPVGHGFASGLDFVPYDNFPAMLHRGERVVTAAENRRNSGQGHTFNIIIQVPDIQSAGSRQTQRQVAEKYKGIMQHVALSG